MTDHESSPGVPADATETLLHERFESAVAGLHLDVPTLVASGTAAGHRLRRRRRLQQVGAGVASLAVIAAGGLLGIHGGLFDSNADSPADHGNVSELVPATSRGLAAAVIADLPSNLRVTDVGGFAAHTKAMEADLHLTDGSRSVSLAAAAIGPHILPAACKSLGTSVVGCRSRALPDGSHVVTGEFRPVGSSGGIGRLLILIRPADTVLVLESQPGSPVGAALPLSDAELLGIAQDPLVGLRTSQAMIAAGEELPKFHRSDLILGVDSSQPGSSTGSGSSHAVSPRVRHRKATYSGGT